MFSGRLITRAADHHTRTHARIHSCSNQTRLQQLISECASGIKSMVVDRHLKLNLAKLDDEFRSHIYDEIKREFDALPNILSADDSLASKTRAQGWELIGALQSTRQFLDNYEVIWPRMDLGAAINTRHLQELAGSFQESFASLKQEDRLLLASVIEPRVLMGLGISLSSDEKKEARCADRRTTHQLNFDQVIALLDYAHYATGTFNGVNSGMRVFEYNRIRTISDVIYCVKQPLIEALALLVLRNEFQFKGTLIKGIQINNPGGPLKRAKLLPGNLLTIPHPTSTTSDPMKSYAQRGTHDSELVFLDAAGIKIHLFHNKLTVNEMEVIIPTEGIYNMVGWDTHNPKTNGSIERFYCKPVRARHLEPDMQNYV